MRHCTIAVLLFYSFLQCYVNWFGKNKSLFFKRLLFIVFYFPLISLSNFLYFLYKNIVPPAAIANTIVNLITPVYGIGSLAVVGSLLFPLLFGLSTSIGSF